MGAMPIQGAGYPREVAGTQGNPIDIDAPPPPAIPVQHELDTSDTATLSASPPPVQHELNALADSLTEVNYLELAAFADGSNDAPDFCEARCGGTRRFH